MSSESRYKVITRPPTDPVIFSDMDSQLRLDGLTDEQSFIERLIKTATRWTEDYCRRYWFNTDLEVYRDRFPSNGTAPIILYGSPLASIDQIDYIDENGAAQTLVPVTDFQEDLKSEPGMAVPAIDTFWPSTQDNKINAVTVKYTSGYDESDASLVPEEAKEAIILLVTHWFENRLMVPTIPGVPTNITAIPDAVKSSLSNLRLFEIL